MFLRRLTQVNVLFSWKIKWAFRPTKKFCYSHYVYHFYRRELTRYYFVNFLLYFCLVREIVNGHISKMTNRWREQKVAQKRCKSVDFEIIYRFSFGQIFSGQQTNFPFNYFSSANIFNFIFLKTCQQTQFHSISFLTILISMICRDKKVGRTHEQWWWEIRINYFNYLFYVFIFIIFLMNHTI